MSTSLTYNVPGFYDFATLSILHQLCHSNSIFKSMQQNMHQLNMLIVHQIIFNAFLGGAIALLPYSLAYEEYTYLNLPALHNETYFMG